MAPRRVHTSADDVAKLLQLNKHIVPSGVWRYCHAGQHPPMYGIVLAPPDHYHNVT